MVKNPNKPGPVKKRPQVISLSPRGTILREKGKVYCRRGKGKKRGEAPDQREINSLDILYQEQCLDTAGEPLNARIGLKDLED